MGLMETAVADRRFKHPDWEKWPYVLRRDQFLRMQAFWDQATRDVNGVQPHHLKVQNFIARQRQGAAPGEILVSRRVAVLRNAFPILTHFSSCTCTLRVVLARVEVSGVGCCRRWRVRR